MKTKPKLIQDLLSILKEEDSEENSLQSESLNTKIIPKDLDSNLDDYDENNRMDHDHNEMDHIHIKNYTQNKENYIQDNIFVRSNKECAEEINKLQNIPMNNTNELNIYKSKTQNSTLKNQSEIRTVSLGNGNFINGKSLEIGINWFTPERSNVLDMQDTFTNNLQYFSIRKLDGLVNVTDITSIKPEVKSSNQPILISANHNNIKEFGTKELNYVHKAVAIAVTNKKDANHLAAISMTDALYKDIENNLFSRNAESEDSVKSIFNWMKDNDEENQREINKASGDVKQKLEDKFSVAKRIHAITRVDGSKQVKELELTELNIIDLIRAINLKLTDVNHETKLYCFMSRHVYNQLLETTMKLEGTKIDNLGDKKEGQDTSGYGLLSQALSSYKIPTFKMGIEIRLVDDLDITKEEDTHKIFVGDPKTFTIFSCDFDVKNDTSQSNIIISSARCQVASFLSGNNFKCLTVKK